MELLEGYSKLPAPLPKPLPKDCYARLYISRRASVVQMSKCFTLKLLEPYLTPEELQTLENNYRQTRVRLSVGVRAFENVSGHLTIEMFPSEAGLTVLTKRPGTMAELWIRKALRPFDLSKYRQISYYLIHRRGNAYIIFPRLNEKMERMKGRNRKYFDTPYRYRPGEKGPEV